VYKPKWPLYDKLLLLRKTVAQAESTSNEVFARKEEQKEIGQLEHNKERRLHQLYVSFMRRI